MVTDQSFVQRIRLRKLLVDVLALLDSKVDHDACDNDKENSLRNGQLARHFGVLAKRESRESQESRRFQLKHSTGLESSFADFDWQDPTVTPVSADAIPFRLIDSCAPCSACASDSVVVLLLEHIFFVA